jgi:DHA1 family bicyclomycin/chloramphenicol resistance-like MFS transporter
MAISVGRAGPPITSEARLLIVLAVATALGPVAMQIFLPALPAIQLHHGVSAAAAQLVFSVSAFAMAVATLLYGPFSDRYGRRPAMLAGLVIFLVGSAMCVLASTITGLIFGRVIQAAGGCVGMVLGRAIVRDLYDRERAATMLAWITMAMVTAPMVSPAIGGALTDYFGWPSVFVAGGLLGLLVILAVWRELPETAPRLGVVTSVREMLRSFGTLLRSRAFIGYAGQAAFSISVFFGFLAGAPYLMIRVYERPAIEYGLYFVLVSGAFMVGNFGAARFTRRVGLERMILLGSSGSLAGALTTLLLALAGVWTPLALFLPMSFGALAQGIAMPNTQAAVVSVRPDLAGAASGLAGFVQMGVAAVAAQTIGSFQTGTPYPMTVGLTLCAALALLSAVFAARARS